MKFNYQGPVGASKSLMNRALIVQSYFPDLHIDGSSDSADVLDLQKCLSQLGRRHQFEIHEGGTTFRFFCLRLSRLEGEFEIRTSARLMQRPQEELIDLLKQLGISAVKSGTSFYISGQGWRKPARALRVERSRSSQFLSSLVLNSARLDFPLEIEMSGESLSENYFAMTLALSQELGLSYQRETQRLILQPWSNLKHKIFKVGADVSSVFALAGLAAVGGELNVNNLWRPELQPDFQFVDFFKAMGIPVEAGPSSLRIFQSSRFRGLDASLTDCPDLFPVLACVCALAEGPSRLFGAPQLHHKESDRLQKIFELFQKAGISFIPRDDGVELTGLSRPHQEMFEFNPDKDHRMAMAAAVLKQAGWKINIKDPSVVEKSFPDFWSISGLQP